MVKGTTHRIIVVKSPDKRYFEEAIFVVRDELLRENGADSKAILKQAHKIADAYVARYRKSEIAKQPKGSKTTKKTGFFS